MASDTELTDDELLALAAKPNNSADLRLLSPGERQRLTVLQQGGPARRLPVAAQTNGVQSPTRAALTDSELRALASSPDIDVLRKLGPAAGGLNDDERSRLDAITAPSGAVGRFLSGAWQNLNPLPMIEAIVSPDARNRMAMNMSLAAIDQYDKAKAAPTTSEKVGHYAAAGLPGIGPAAANAGEAIASGDYAGGAGQAFGLLAPFAVEPVAKGTSSVVRRIAPARAPTPPRLTPVEASANTFAQQHGIPLDAATATGSPSLRAAQQRVQNSMGGEGTATRMISAQAEGLTRAGERLAHEVHPEPVTPEQTGQSVRDVMSGLIQELHKQAGVEYDKLRAAEAAPEHASTVPRAKSGAQIDAVRLEQQRSLGRVPTSAELHELRRIREELNAYGYEDKTWNATDDFTAAGRRTSQAGGKFDIVAGHGGAPVYDDIVGSMEGAPTRGQLLAQIDHALETGQYRSEGAKNAIDVAGRRLEGDRSLAAPILPPEAGDAGRPRMQTMGLAVDVRPVKQALDPIYQQLKREGELVPLHGEKGRALVALDRLVRGPDHVPLSIADAALSDLKAMARGAEPGLRTVAQGKAALAVRALDEVVQARAAAAGKPLLDALQIGRATTKAKYETADLLDQLRSEPVKVFDQLTAPRDTGISLLRHVQDVAAQQVRELGRAKLQSMLDLATERGRFEHTDKLYADWQRLGPETKRILFGADQIAPLNDFFLLAKRLGEVPNKSGTAQVLTALNVGTVPATWALSKLLFTSRGVQAVTKLLRVELAPAVRTMTRNAAWAEVMAAASAAGVPLSASELPKAADAQPRRRPTLAASRSDEELRAMAGNSARVRGAGLTPADYDRLAELSAR